MENVLQYTEEYIQDRLQEIDTEAAEIRQLKSKNKVTVEDIEDVSDNYQYNLEWNELLMELQHERDFLIQKRNEFHKVED